MAEVVGHAIENDPADDVGRAAPCKGNDDADRTFRIFFACAAAGAATADIAMHATIAAARRNCIDLIMNVPLFFTKPVIAL